MKGFYFIEDEDDASTMTANTVGRKRTYSESTVDAMSLKSRSTSRYRGEFIKFLSITKYSEYHLTLIYFHSYKILQNDLSEI